MIKDKKEGLNHEYSYSKHNSKELFKICTFCKIKYPATSEFFHRHKLGKYGFNPVCKKCKKSFDKKYHKLKNFNISMNEFRLKLKEQDNRCAISGRNFDKLYSTRKKNDRSPRIDHNHKTGKIRGILCNSCNVLLGQCNDNSLILINALRYLRKYK